MGRCAETDLVPEERVIVIDTDLGQSGASTDREGFQRLVAEVGMGHAGIDLLKGKPTAHQLGTEKR